MHPTLRSHLTTKLNRAIEDTDTPEEAYEFIKSQIALEYKLIDSVGSSRLSNDTIDFWIKKAVSHYQEATTETTNMNHDETVLFRDMLAFINLVAGACNGTETGDDADALIKRAEDIAQATRGNA